METLKIAFYTDSYLPSIDGVVTSIIETRRELERRGHEVYIFAAGNKQTEKLAKKDHNLIVLKGIKFRRYPQYTFALSSDYSDYIRQIKPDIIHAHTPFSAGMFALRAKRSTGAGMVSTFHTYIFSESALAGYLGNSKLAVRLAKSAMLKYTKWFYQKSDAVIAPTRFVKNILSDNGIGKVHVIPTGVDFSKFKRINRDTARRKLGIKKTDRVILYFGRVSHEKNLDFLVRAASVVCDDRTKLVLAGSGPYLQHLKRVSKLLNNKSVKFPGFIPDGLKSYYYSAADMFCNPSLFETQSLVSLLAAYYHVPLLIPDKTAQVELLDYSKCGIKFSPDSIWDLAGKVEEVYSKRKSFEFDGVVRNFDIRNTADRLVSLYRKVI